MVLKVDILGFLRLVDLYLPADRALCVNEKAQILAQPSGTPERRAV